jgi:preprotein translocase subunit SecG
MNLAIIIVHSIVSVTLVALVLMHSGKGTGMSEMFGGAGASSSGSQSTVVEKNLDRLTIIVALIFALTTILLALNLR